MTRAVDLFASDGGGSPYVTECPAPHFITTRLRSMFLENLEYSHLRPAPERRVRRQGLVGGDDRAHPLRADAARADRGLHRLCRADAAAAGLGAPGADRRAAGRHRGGARQARDAERRRGAAGRALAAGLVRGADDRRRQAALVGLEARHAATIPTGRASRPRWRRRAGGCSSTSTPISAGSRGTTRSTSRRWRRATWCSSRTARRSSIRNTSFDAAVIDLSNPGARAWIKGVIKGALIGEAGRLGLDERLRRGADVRQPPLRRRRPHGLAQPLSRGMGADEPRGDRGGRARGGHHLLRPLGLHPQPGDRHALLARRPDADLGRVRRHQDRGRRAPVRRGLRVQPATTATPAATWR